MSAAEPLWPLAAERGKKVAGTKDGARDTVFRHILLELKKLKWSLPVLHSFTANSVGFRRGARVRGLGGENQALHQRLLEAEIPRGLGR